jgi:hypothetical protein
MRTFVIGATISQWFNVFVLVAQLFLKVPSLHVLAPTGAELPFAVAQALDCGEHIVRIAALAGLPRQPCCTFGIAPGMARRADRIVGC